MTSLASPSFAAPSHRSVRNACAFLAATLLMAGCTTPPPAYPSADTTKYTLENTDRFSALDAVTQRSVACTGLQERRLADGRMEVIANLKNRDARPLDFQASCLFLDEHGQPAGSEPAWQNVALTENSTEAVRFTSAGPTAKSYTIQVRQTR